MTEAPQILLVHHLKTLKLPTFLRDYEKQARQCATEGLDHVQFLSRLVEMEMIDRERRMVERRIKAAKFPAAKSLDSFDFKAIPKLNKIQVLDLARCEWIERRENVIALGPSGTGKTHVARRLGLAACQRGLPTRFITAATLVSELMGPATNAACCGCKNTWPTSSCSSSTNWASCRFPRPAPNCCSN
jgi:DNA replication protein DnaC